mgnify:CR=1 FL=1
MCERALGGFTPAPVCRGCLSAVLALEAESSCTRCGLPFETNLPASGPHLCGLCRLAPPAFDTARSFGVYEADLRRLIHLLKYDGMRPLVKVLAAKMAPVTPRVGDVELVVPVPLHRSRRWSRQFNQADLLARELSRLTAIPLRSKCLRRVRLTLSQAGLSHRRRRENVKGAFAAEDIVSLKGRRVLLVDDVMTTGATLDACAQALKAAGARSVACLTIARAKRRLIDPNPGRSANVSFRQTRAGETW